MLGLYRDLKEMLGKGCLDWEIVFEFRLKRARYVRIYADVLVITEDKVFSTEFKMKDVIDPDEVSQAAKYCPNLEIVFGPDYEVIAALVLTSARERLEFAPIGGKDLLLPVCSGDMLFNVFDEHLGSLRYGRYPIFLKKRILSDHGHLSNDACAEAVAQLADRGTKHFSLSHLSQENNRPDLALECVQKATEGMDVTIEVLPVYGEEMITVPLV